MSKSRVIINGQVYDALTGLKIESTKNRFSHDVLTEENFAEKSHAKKSESPRNEESQIQKRISAKQKQQILAKKVAAEFENSKEADNKIQKKMPEKFAKNRTHQQNTGRKPQNSKTLHRKFVKKPLANYQAPSKRKIAIQEAATHPLVHKFDAPRENPIYRPKLQPRKKVLDANDKPAPEIFPEDANVFREKNYSGPELKEILFNEKMTDPKAAEIHAHEAKKSAKIRKQAIRKRRLKTSTIMATGLAVLLVSGFLAYTQMPNLSVRVAANRAGIDATNPRILNGYSINGPVAYTKGTVTINYKNNSGGEGYSVIQEAKSQNSVKELIDPKNEKNYETIKSGDMIIYRSGDRAMWRNGDVIYTIIGDQNLSDDQILEIAVNA